MFGQRTGYGMVTALSQHILGCVALAQAESPFEAGIAPWAAEASEAREAHARATRLSRESIATYREYDVDLTIWPRSILAAAERGLGNLIQARHHLAQALQICVQAEPCSFYLSLKPLLVTALLLADAGEHARAVELYALASRYPLVSNSRWFERVFGRHIEAVAATLPSEVATAARERGRARDLQATVKELLADFDA